MRLKSRLIRLTHRRSVRKFWKLRLLVISSRRSAKLSLTLHQRVRLTRLSGFPRSPGGVIKLPTCSPGLSQSISSCTYSQLD